MVYLLAYNPIAKREFLGWNDTSKMPFAIILYKLFLGFANEVDKG